MAGAMEIVSPELVRRLAITRQRLAGPMLPATPAGMLDLVRELGCLQLDPISVVARSNHLVLWSRLGAYDLAHLDTLLWQDRQLFEYWAHCAALVLTEDYPIHQVMMRNVAESNDSWSRRIRTWINENAELRTAILGQLAGGERLPSRSFEDIAAKEWQSSGCNGGRNVGRMLDMLWLAGTIMVAGRVGGQKLWALSEYCLPDWTPRSPLSAYEMQYRAVQRAVRALGVARPQHIQQHFVRGQYPDLKAVLADLEAAGVLVRVAINETTRPWAGPWYIHSADLPLLSQLAAGAWQPRTTLLSPFDNLICNRERTELLWNFFFRIEIYVPKAKRQYGYYVLPILHGDQLIGRLDPIMDRKSGRLVINNVYAEPNAPTDPATGQAVGGAVEQLALFLGAREIVYAGAVPTGWQQALRSSGVVSKGVE